MLSKFCCIGLHKRKSSLSDVENREECSNSEEDNHLVLNHESKTDSSAGSISSNDKPVGIRKKQNSGDGILLQKDDVFYNMNFKKRGIAVIFNHRIFNVPGLTTRNGTEVDDRNLTDILSTLEFDVRNHCDLTFDEMRTIVYELSQFDHSDYDCFLMAILSHGGLNGTLYAKDKSYKFDTVIMDKFKPDKCPSLANKPKLFLIQACHSNKLDIGCFISPKYHSGTSDRLMPLSESASPKRIRKTRKTKIPINPDFLVAYSTVPRYVPWRDSENGSWFIQAFCEEMSAHGTEYDLLTLLTFVNRRVALNFETYLPDNKEHRQKKQMLYIISTLIKLAKFAPKSKEAS